MVNQGQQTHPGASKSDLNFERGAQRQNTPVEPNYHHKRRESETSAQKPTWVIENLIHFGVEIEINGWATIQRDASKHSQIWIKDQEIDRVAKPTEVSLWKGAIWS